MYNSNFLDESNLSRILSLCFLEIVPADFKCIVRILLENYMCNKFFTTETNRNLKYSRKIVLVIQLSVR